MKHVLVAAVGENNSAIYSGIREFPTEMVYLLATQKGFSEAKKIEKDLTKFKVPVKILQVDAKELFEETFKRVGDIVKSENGRSVLINAGCGDSTARCAATCAAFVNGVKAFDIANNKVRMLPVLKFSYYRLLPEKKMGLLKILAREHDCCASLEQLAKRSGMSLPLVSYHVNGSRKVEGLKQMGLVDTSEKKGRVAIKLSSLGELLVSGYI